VERCGGEEHQPTGGRGKPNLRYAFAAEGVRMARPLADHHRVGVANSVLATVEGTTGRLDDARAALDPMIRLVEGAESPPFVPGLTRAMATCTNGQGGLGAAAIPQPRWKLLPITS
jgi:hypothetical protein